MVADKVVTEVCSTDEHEHARLRELEAGMLDDREAVRLAEMFKTLGDPTRLRIISALANGEVCVHELAKVLHMSQSAVSHQLRVLRHQGLVRFRKVGRHVYYTLDDDHVRDVLDRALKHIAHQE